MRAFLSYAHVDRQWFDAARKWLSRLRHSGIATVWTDHDLTPGELWDACLRAEIDAADVVIFLVTQNFERSEYINHVEVERAIAGSRASGKLLIAIHCEPSTAKQGPLREFQAVPSHGAPPISRAPDAEAAWEQVFTDVADACERHRTQLDLPALNAGIADDKALTMLPPLFAGSRRRSLASLYVELRLLPRAIGALTRIPMHGATTLAARQTEDERQRHAVNLSLEQAIAISESGRFVITGDPGSGKSSVMRRIALDVAERKGAWQRWDCAILVELRRLIRSKPPGERWTPELLIGLAFEPWLKSVALAGRAAKLYANGLTGSGRPLLLFDGLDEIAADPASHEDITDLIARLPREIDWVVTSRITGLFGDLMEDERYEIAPLDEGGIEVLVSNWFGEGSSDADRARRDAMARRLLSEIAHNARLIEMARNPFLLSAVCFLRESEPDSDLPLTRAGVYRCLFDQIARHAQQHYGNRTILDGEAMRALETFAHWTYERGGISPLQIFHVNHWADCRVETGHAVDFHARILPARLLIQESELSDTYYFVHLSLHEYLVARGCLRERLGDVINLRYRPQWRPIIQFFGALLVEQGRRDDFRRLACAMAEPPDLTHRMLIEVAQLFQEAGIEDTRPDLGYDLTERLWTAFCEGDTHISRAALHALWRAPWSSIEPRILHLAAEMRKNIEPLGEAATRFDMRRRFHPNPYLLLAGRRDGQSEEQLLNAFIEEKSEDVAGAMVEALALSLSRAGRPQVGAAARRSIGTPRERRFLLLLEEAPHPDFVPLLDHWIAALDPEDDGHNPYRRLVRVLNDIPGDESVPILEREAMRCLAHSNRVVRLTRVTEIAAGLARVRSRRRIDATERIIAATREIDADQAATIETATEPFDGSSDSLAEYLDDFEHPFHIQTVLEKIIEAQDLQMPAALIELAERKLDAALGGLIEVKMADFGPWAALLNVDRLRVEAGAEPVLDRRVEAALSALVAKEHPPLDPSDPAGDWQDVEIPGVALEDEGLPFDDVRGRYTALSGYAAVACRGKAVLDPMLRVAAAPLTLWGRASRCSALIDIALLADGGEIADKVARGDAVRRLTEILAEAEKAGETLIAEHCAWAIGCIDLQALMELRGRYNVIQALMRFSSERDYLIYETYSVTPDGRSDVMLPPVASLFVVMDTGYGGPLVESFLHHALHWGFEQAVSGADRCLAGVIIAPQPTEARDLDASLRGELVREAGCNAAWPVLLISTDADHAAKVAHVLSITVATAIVRSDAATSADFAAVRSTLSDWLKASTPVPRSTN